MPPHLAGKWLPHASGIHAERTRVVTAKAGKQLPATAGQTRKRPPPVTNNPGGNAGGDVDRQKAGNRLKSSFKGKSMRLETETSDSIMDGEKSSSKEAVVYNPKRLIKTVVLDNNSMQLGSDALVSVGQGNVVKKMFLVGFVLPETADMSLALMP
ncbi:hypothetical protein FRC08_012737 [Ceratobasidium sp. 394]|nr:hypothetical protein FRC08_012737 [Ceratobasidium sp. 394]